MPFDPLLKAFEQGDPGTAKTGGHACLVNTGKYRAVLADFDGNYEALLMQIEPQFRSNLIVVPFGDELVAKDSGVERAGPVSAVRLFTKFLYSGNSEAGKPKDWGHETILIWDNLSSFCDNGMRLALQLNRGVTRDGAHIGVLADEVEVAMAMFMGPGSHLHCHRAIISHLKLISPRPESSYSGETELQKQIKRERAALEETGYFPNMPGNATARNIARMANTALLYEFDERCVDENKGLSGLVIRTKPMRGYTIKVPVPVADKLPIETGLLTIMQAFGAAMKGVGA